MSLVDDAQQLAIALQKQFRSRKPFPEGHTIAIAYAKVFGPKNATTPEGHPITICSGAFDNTVETAAHAIARAAKKWHRIEIHEPHWELELAEDVVITNAHPLPQYTKVYHFRYLPERWKWEGRGLNDANVPNHFRDSSWYITHRHRTPDYKLDQSLATALIPAKATE